LSTVADLALNILESNMRQHILVLSAFVALSGCNRNANAPGSPDASVGVASAPLSQAPGLSPSFDIAQLQKRVHFSYRAAANGGFEGGHSTYAVRVDRSGVLSFEPYVPAKLPAPPNSSMKTPVALASRPPVIEKAKKGATIQLATSAIAGIRTAVGTRNKVSISEEGAVQITHGPAVETLRNTEFGVEQSWRFDQPPSPGDLIVRVALSGHDYSGATTGGLHFVDPATGIGVRYGNATWIDAGGTRTSVKPTFDSGEVVLTVPADIVASSTFPATLDPVLSAEQGADSPVDGPATSTRGNSHVVFDGTNSNYVIFWLDSRAGFGSSQIYAARVNTSGSLLDQDGLPLLATSDDITGVACESSQCLVLFMTQLNALTSASIIHGRFYNFSARTLGADIPIVTADGQSPGGSVAFNGTDYLVAYPDNLYTTIPPGLGYFNTVSETMYAKLVSPAGAVGSRFTVAQDVGSCVPVCNITNAGLAANACTIPPCQSSASRCIINPDFLCEGNLGLGTPVVASDGTNFNVVWSDIRRQDGQAQPECVCVFDTGPTQVNTIISQGVGVTGTLTAGLVGGQNVLGGTTPPTAASQPSVVFDGNSEWVIAYIDSGNQTNIIQASSTSFAFQTGASQHKQVTTSAVASAPALTHNGTSIMLTWLDTATAKNLTAASVTSSSSISSGTQFTVASEAGSGASMAAASGTNFLASYSSFHDTANPSQYPSPTEIYAAGLNPASTTTSFGPNRVSNSLNDEGNQAVAFDGTNFLVVWQDTRLGPDQQTIFGARVKPDGTLLNSSGVACPSGSNCAFQISGSGSWSSPAVAYNSGSNTYLVVYRGNSIAAAEVTPAGVVSHQDTVIGSGDSPTVASDGTDFLVAYEAGACDCSSVAIRGVRVNPDTTLPGGSFTLASPAPNTSPSFSIAYAGGAANKYLLVWDDNSPGHCSVTTTTGCFSFGQCPAGHCSVTTATSCYSDAYCPTGETCIGAETCIASTTGLDVYGQFITPGTGTSPGTLSGSPFTITTANGDQTNPSVTYDQTNFVAVWSDGRAAPAQIFGARVSSAGSVLDPTSCSPASCGVHVSTTSVNNQLTPVVTYDGTNEIVVWRDLTAINTATVKTDLTSATLMSGGASSSLQGPAATASSSVGVTAIVYPQVGTASSLRVAMQILTNLQNGQTCGTTNNICASNTCSMNVCCQTTCTGGSNTCASGSCVACPTGFGNCDGNSTTSGTSGGSQGCEVNLNTDPNHCGSCTAVACTTAVAHASPICNNGTCDFACNTGFTRCSGACVDITSDPANCGGCGRACSSTNVATLSCASSVCNSTCVTSPIVYGNCTQPTFPTADDGCETQISNITDSPIAITGYTTATFPFANCGACGTTCTDASARASHSTHMCVPTGGGAAACRSFDRAQIVTARCSGASACASSCSTSSSTAPCYQALTGEVMNLAADQGPDTDGDGIFDAWETQLANPRSGDVSAPAGVNTAAMNPVGIDFNGDGSIDTTNDFVFSSVVAAGDMPDPRHKDAYVRIRSMEQEPAATTAASCTTDANCQAYPACAYPFCKAATHHCAQTATALTSPGAACSTNTDCQLACRTPYCDTRATTIVAGGANPGQNHCSEDPATGHAPDPAAPGAVPACGTATTSVISMVQQAYACSPVTNPDATTGIRLHIDYTPTPTLPHYNVLQVQSCDTCTVTADGQYFPPATNNVKSYFGSDLAKIQYVFRFLSFAHSFCKSDGSGNSFSGNSEIYGNDSVVTLGTSMFKLDTTNTTKAQTRLAAWAGTTMHEGGHAFDLIHYNQSNGTSGLPEAAPNFVSVMNYDYQFGIYTTAANGSPAYTALPATADPSIPPHIDYGRTLGDTLVENTLTEGNGIKAGGYGTNDLISFACPTSLCNLATGAGCRNYGWANGGSVSGSGIDWNCSGGIDSAPVPSPIDGDGDTVNSLNGWGGIPPLPAAQTANGDEWGNGLAYGFLCQPTFADGAPLPPSRISQDEISVEFATTHHYLSGGPPLGARIDVRPLCSSNFVTLGNSGLMPVAIFGAANLDVSAIELSSLSLSGAAAVGSATFSDIDGDTFTDMLVNFRMSDLQITASSTRVLLSGALGSGQQFFGSDSISFVPYPGPVVTIKNDGTGYAFSLVDQLDHVMVPYSVGDGVLSAVDRCGNNLLPSINSMSSMVNLTADEANDVNLHGTSAHQGPDIGITGSSSFWVRRERDATGAGNGRVYTATFNITDNCLGCGGNTREAWFKIQVPHDASGITAVDTCLCTSGLECPDCVLPSGATCTSCDPAFYAP
jgi:hypothetical protein